MHDDAAAVQAIVTQWMRWARSDLALANMTQDERILSEILAFHAQQAVDKALKAILVREQVEFPRTHVIATLINLCDKAGYQCSALLADAVILTRYAVATRYPSAEEPVSRQEALEAALIATQMIEWVEGLLASTSPTASSPLAEEQDTEL